MRSSVAEVRLRRMERAAVLEMESTDSVVWLVFAPVLYALWEVLREVVAVVCAKPHVEVPLVARRLCVQIEASRVSFR